MIGRAVTVFPEEVAEGVRQGNSDAVGAVYVALADRLLGYLVARVHDRAAAEDLLEATFIELLQNGTRIQGGSAAIKVWLFRSAYFNAMDHLRRVKRRAEDLYEYPADLEVYDEDRGPEEWALAAETGRQMRSAMESLSEDQRHVLLLRYIGGLSAPEAASVLGKSDGAVRSLQHRGERSLARMLEPAAPAPSRSSATSSS